VVLVPSFAAATGISALAAFRLIRFLTGIGEAAISSNVTRVIASWTARRERGFASGLQVCGLGLGGTLTPAFIAWTMTRWGWRVSFAACSLLGFAAVALWHWYATDWPEQHPGVNDAELQAVHPGEKKKPPAKGVSRSVPWDKMLTSTSVWALIIGYGLHGYAFYVYYNWFYFYAVKMRGLAVMQAAFWTAAPFLAMAILSLGPVDAHDRYAHRPPESGVAWGWCFGRSPLCRQSPLCDRGGATHDRARRRLQHVRCGELLGCVHRFGAAAFGVALGFDEHHERSRRSHLGHSYCLGSGSSKLDRRAERGSLGHGGRGPSLRLCKRQPHDRRSGNITHPQHLCQR
jgi:MFS family permease